RLAPVHRPLREVRPGMDPELDEVRAQQIDALAGGQLPGVVLTRDLLLAAAQPRLGAPFFEVKRERSQHARSVSAARPRGAARRRRSPPHGETRPSPSGSRPRTRARPAPGSRPTPRP